MSDLSLKERFIYSLERKKVDKIPVCSVTQTGIVELMEITGAKWPDAHYDPEKMATLAIAAHELIGLEAVRYPFCNTVIAETLGCTIETGSLDTQPQMLDFPCKKKEDVAGLSIPDKLLESKRIQIILKATDIIKSRLSDDVPVVAGILGPAAIACYLCGVNNYLRWCITSPEVLNELIALGTSVCTEYANALFDRGVDAVVIIDSEAGPDLLPPPLFESLILPQYRLLTKNLNGHSILHICGDATDVLDMMAASGFEGLSVEEKVNLTYASQVISGRACLIGNVSPAVTLLGKSPENIKKEAKQCIEDGAGILAPGCGIAPRTPIENIRAFVAARDEYYSEKGV
ncbi:methylcobamide:CoM methyltransferase MtaA [Methanolobus psychrotolerans]|uniref:methylcobamide:CoM methyltransferase MtaA n=1 Tax=Methanolobus psychrotolerans TaxID=1874706 RepID=UPI000B91988F|nr:methylcobamide:CoM methyltransferase MtaA [Methanolobus psychrotolerans]